MNSLWLRSAAAIIVAGNVSAFAATLHKDEFSTSDPAFFGWGGGVGLAEPGTGGPAGSGDGYLELSTLASNLATKNDRADWTGSFAAVNAARVKVDMRNAVGSDPLSMRVVLFGPVSTSERWTSAEPVDVPADGLWHSYEFSLAADALAHVAGTASYAALMDNVVRFMLRHDPSPASSSGEPASATLGLDNIELAAAAAPASPADFNHDAHVDGADLAIWSGAFGSSGAADANNDGASTGADFLIWQRSYAPAATAAVSAAPEPAGLALAFTGIGAAIRRCVAKRASRLTKSPVPGT